MLTGWVPGGTLAVYATNRGMPGTDGLTRDQRKLLALRTLCARASEFAESPSKLSVFRPDRWCRISLGFEPPSGRFLGWYIDFQLPVRTTPLGLATKDLVLDMWINPDRTWEWKDRDDLEVAIAEGLVEPAHRAALDREADHILAELADGAAPFTAEFTQFAPDGRWPAPALPRTHSWSGDAWSLPAGLRAT